MYYLKRNILCYQLLNLFLAVSFVATAQKKSETKKPNIVFIVTDQWRASSFGYAGDDIVQTPNLDKFAKEAVNLSNTVSVTPVCTPHRAALFTGKYPTSTGMFLNDLYLPSEELCMAEIYKEAGYQTAYIGKWHLDGHGRELNVAPNRRQGFEYWKGTECSHDYNKMPYYENENPEQKIWKGYSTFAMADDANQYFEKHAKDANPFLMVVSLGTPHFPHNTAPKQYQALYPDEKLKLNPNVPEDLKQEVFKELRGYYGHCTATDKAIGDMINKLKELNMYDNSIIVFTSDHGEMMGAHGVRPNRKQLAWNESSHVPFLISYPDMFKNKGKTFQLPLTTPDILPTLLALSNIAIPKGIEGENLAETIKKGDINADRTALYMNISPFSGNFLDPEYRALRTKQYSYIKFLNSAMLFDNDKDPYQLDNLIDKPDFQTLKTTLDNQLKQQLVRTGDDFKPREYYIKKWGFNLNTKDKTNIRYNFGPEEKHIVQSPVKKL